MSASQVLQLASQATLHKIASGTSKASKIEDYSAECFNFKISVSRGGKMAISQ